MRTGTITPRGASFMVSFGSGKDRVRVTKKTLPEAEAELARLEAEAIAEAAALAVVATKGDPSKTLQDAYDLAYRTKWKNSKGERTTLLNAKQMVALLGPNTPVAAIDSDAIANALNELEDGDDEREGNSTSTVNKKLAALNVMLKEARGHGWIKDVPYTKRRAEGKRRTYFYTDEDEAQMVAACYRLGLPVLADFITFGVETGLRRAEMLKLKVEDCAERTIRLHDGETKNDSGRVVPTTDLAEAVIQKARDRGCKRVFEDLTVAILRTMWDSLRTHLGKDGDPKYIVHVLRHTCATRLAKKGATAPQIKEWMGHKAIQTTMIYIHLVGTDLHGVADLLRREPAPRPALKVVNGG